MEVQTFCRFGIVVKGDLIVFSRGMFIIFVANYCTLSMLL